MARHILNRSALALGVGLLALSCKHHPAPAPAPSAAPADSATEGTRQSHFESELQRSRALWQEKPTLGNCADILHEKADEALCPAASNALGAVEALGPDTTPDRVLPVLADAALSLVRLLERARYLNFQELGRRRLEGDAGAPAGAAGSAPPRVPSAPKASAEARSAPRAGRALLRERESLKLVDSPVSHLVQDTARLERELLRHFAAYLEYGPLPVRQAAFDAAKALHAQHLRWPALNHMLREAAILETDSALKQNLTELAKFGLAPSRPKPDQPTGSK